MTTFAGRRLRNFGLVSLAIGAVAATDHLYDLSLRDSAFFNGWLLTGCMVFLTLMNLRKKVPVLSFVPVSAWLQLHVYVGLLCAVLFFIHAGLRLPMGTAEAALWLGCVGLIASGAIGLLLSRHLPHRISGCGERVFFERIPALCTQLTEQAQELALKSVAQSGSSSIADFYVAQLDRYLRRPRNFWSHVLEHHRPLRHMQTLIAEMKQYQDADGRAILGEIGELVESKDQLDRQHAFYLVLKGWLFLHIPLTYGVLLVSATHILVVYALASGAP